MAKKNPAEEEEKAEPQIVCAEGETIKCPIHTHRNIILEVQRNKLIGICRCDVEDNRWAGKTVIEIAQEKE